MMQPCWVGRVVTRVLSSVLKLGNDLQKEKIILYRGSRNTKTFTNSTIYIMLNILFI